MLTTPRTLGLALALLALAVAPLASAAPPGTNCGWNHAFTDPIEDTGLAAFHDGTVCTVTPFPCPNNPNAVCNPLPRIVE